jgi:di/tricarboxylate transporter
MLGGTLTLVGTSTNLLASDISRDLLGEPYSMFTLTPVGVVVLLVGVAYLLTVGRALVPPRVTPKADVTESFDMDRHLARLVVRDDSPLVGHTVGAALDDGAVLPADPTEDPTDVDVLQIDRDSDAFFAPATDVALSPGDVLTVRGSRQAANRFARRFGLRQLPREQVTEAVLTDRDHEGVLAEAIVHGESRLLGRTLGEMNLRPWFDTTVLAVRRGETVLNQELDTLELAAGDLLLLQTPADKIGHLEAEGYLLLTDGPPELFEVVTDEGAASLDRAALVPVGILAAVIALAATGLVDIYIVALAGVVAMVASGSLSASKAYDSVSWNVIFLLAGLLPLGTAMQSTGGAAVVGGVLAGLAQVLPPLGLLAVCYLLTALLASLITPVATVVLMGPISVATAASAGLEGFPFLVVVTFAVATAFLTPIGYQTNLMVYGPGGYRFTDYARVGAPLQLLLCLVTTLSVAAIWSL